MTARSFIRENYVFRDQSRAVNRLPLHGFGSLYDGALFPEPADGAVDEYERGKCQGGEFEIERRQVVGGDFPSRGFVDRFL